MKRNYFIDYDETLYSHRSRQIPESAISALRMIQENGDRVFLASGRNFYQNLTEAFGTYPYIPNGTINANGGLVEVDGKIIFNKSFQPDQQKSLIRYALDKGYCLMYSLNGIWYATDLDHCLETEPPEEHVILKGLEDFLKHSHTSQYCFYLNNNEDAVQDIERSFPFLQVLRMSESLTGADIIPLSSGKEQGIRRILDFLGESWDSVIAIGDSMNDYSMIRHARLGIAMGNALPALKEVSSYVTADIEQDGLAQAVAYAQLILR